MKFREYLETNNSLNEEDFSSLVKRQLKRLGKKIDKVFWWDGYKSPKEMQADIHNMSDADLALWVAHDQKNGPNSQNEFQAKLMKRELKRRYGISPNGNMHESDEIHTFIKKIKRNNTITITTSRIKNVLKGVYTVSDIDSDGGMNPTMTLTNDDNTIKNVNLFDVDWKH